MDRSQLFGLSPSAHNNLETPFVRSEIERLSVAIQAELDALGPARLAVLPRPFQLSFRTSTVPTENRTRITESRSNPGAATIVAPGRPIQVTSARGMDQLEVFPERMTVLMHSARTGGDFRYDADSRSSGRRTNDSSSDRMSGVEQGGSPSPGQGGSGTGNSGGNTGSGGRGRGGNGPNQGRGGGRAPTTLWDQGRPGTGSGGFSR